MRAPTTRLIRFISIAVTALTVCSGIEMAAPTPAHAATTTTCDTAWTRPRSGKFGDPKNWTHGLPTGGVSACLPDFDGSTRYYVTLVGPAKAQALTIGRTATLTLQPAASALTLSVSDSIENDGTIQQGQAPRTSVIAVGTGGLVNRGSFMNRAGQPYEQLGRD